MRLLTALSSSVLNAAIFFSCTIPLSHAETFAIKGGKIYTMVSEQPISKSTILIVDGKITNIGKDIQIPKNATIINAQNSIITPGFMSSASNLGLTEVLAVSVTNDFAAGSNETFDPSYGFNPNSTLIPIVRNGGLTRAVVIPIASDTPIAGVGFLINLGLGSELITQPKNAFYADMGERGAKLAGGSRGAAWRQLNTLFKEASAYRNNINNIAPKPKSELKSKPKTTPDNLLAVVKVLNKEIPLVATVDRASDIRNLITFSIEFDIKVIVLGGAESWMVAKQLAQLDIPVILDPTHNFPDLFETLNARSDTAALLHKAGVKMGFSMPRLIGLRTPDFSHNADKIRISAGTAVSNGLPYFAALKSLTTEAAQIWGVTNNYGTLAVGQDADIVIWSGDPLETMTYTVEVFIKGQLMPKTTRHTLLRDRYSPKNLNKKLPAKYH